MKEQTTPYFETPTALSHDASTLAAEARGLLNATSEIADEKIGAARKRLASALEASKETYARLQEKVAQGAKVVDQTVRTHPYEAVAVGFGIGLLIGCLVSRRS